MTPSNHDQATIRQYLLGQLTDLEQQKVEERLLTEDDLFEELEVSKDELVEEYLAGQLSRNEHEWFEQNLLTSPEGKQRRVFTRALNRYVLGHANEFPPAPTWFERVSAFWNSHATLLRPATAAAVVVIVVGIFWLTRSPAPHSFATLTLANVSTTRSIGDDSPKVRFNEDVLRIILKLPEPAAPGARYRVELADDKGGTRTQEVAGHDPQSVLVEFPAAQLPRGQYAITLSTISAGGNPVRIPGSYYFTVE